MDYIHLKKSSPLDLPKYNLTKYNTRPHSPPNPPSFRNTPSPNRINLNNTLQPTTLLKHYLDPPTSTQHNTPLAISRSQLFSVRTHEDIDQLIVDQRFEIQTLLLEIGKLQQELQQVHQLRELQVRRTRQEFEESAYLQASQLRQSQLVQAQVFELQIRKLKDQLNDKSEEHKHLESLLAREKDSNEREKNRFKEQVRLLIEKKNAEIFQLKQEGDNKMRQLQLNSNNQMEQTRYACDRELVNLNKQLQQYQDKLSKLKSFSQTQDRQKQKQINYLQNQRDSIEIRYQQRLVEQTNKYQNVRNNFNNLINQFNQDSQTSRTELQRIFQAEYLQLINLIKTKEKDNTQLRKQLDTTLLTVKIEKTALKEENQYLQQRIKQFSQNSLADMQLLKVKLAALHQTDLTQLKQLYDLKLKHSSNNLIRLDQENSKLREFTHLLSAEKYQLKKKYQITISELNSKIMKMRMGISTMQNEFKQKIQNEKSVMLMTSRSFLKEAEAKNTTHKFLQEEIRKLRQLMELQGRENQNIEKAVEQKILAANNELERLSNKVLFVAKEKQELEAALELLRTQKDQEIAKLRAELNSVDMPERGILPELKMIEELRQEVSTKKEENGLLKDKISFLESRIKEMHAESERLQMQSNISSDQIRKEFHVVAEKHLEDFKKYYQQKLARVEQQKAQLKKIVSNQYEQITELIKKYKQIQEDLKQAVKMMKKRTQLEEKVMNIGLDVNLVKNMAQLLPNNKNL